MVFSCFTSSNRGKDILHKFIFEVYCPLTGKNVYLEHGEI